MAQIILIVPYEPLLGMVKWLGSTPLIYIYIYTHRCGVLTNILRMITIQSGWEARSEPGSPKNALLIRQENESTTHVNCFCFFSPNLVTIIGYAI